MACAADELTNNESASGSSSTGGLLLAKERPGRLLCDGDLRLIEVLRVRLGIEECVQVETSANSIYS